MVRKEEGGEAGDNRTLDLERTPGLRFVCMDRADTQHLTPAEMAERTGLSLDTLRYYERIGLITDVDRGDSGRRRYSAADVGWVDVLRCLRTTGMPIARMQQFAELCRVAGTAAQRLDLLVQHRDDVVDSIAELQRALLVIEGKIAAYRNPAETS